MNNKNYIERSITLRKKFRHHSIKGVTLLGFTDILI